MVQSRLDLAWLSPPSTFVSSQVFFHVTRALMPKFAGNSVGLQQQSIMMRMDSQRNGYRGFWYGGLPQLLSWDYLFLLFYSCPGCITLFSLVERTPSLKVSRRMGGCIKLILNFYRLGRRSGSAWRAPGDDFYMSNTQWNDPVTATL